MGCSGNCCPTHPFKPHVYGFRVLRFRLFHFLLEEVVDCWRFGVRLRVLRSRPTLSSPSPRWEASEPSTSAWRPRDFAAQTGRGLVTTDFPQVGCATNGARRKSESSFWKVSSMVLLHFGLWRLWLVGSKRDPSVGNREHCHQQLLSFCGVTLSSVLLPGSVDAQPRQVPCVC